MCKLRDGRTCERRIEVDLASDGRFVVASLGGGMPVAIRLSREEAVGVRARLDALLAEPVVGLPGASRGR